MPTKPRRSSPAEERAPAVPNSRGAGRSLRASSSPKAPVLLSPPPEMTIPRPPPGFVPTRRGYRGIVPTALELAALPPALTELETTTALTPLLALAGLSDDTVRQSLEVANEWSVLRRQLAAWEDYVQEQEGLAWERARKSMARLKPLIELASAGRQVSPCPKVAALLNVKRSFAATATSTKRRNRAAVAEGEPPAHGSAGRRRERALAKRLVAEQKSK